MLIIDARERWETWLILTSSRSERLSTLRYLERLEDRGRKQHIRFGVLGAISMELQNLAGGADIKVTDMLIYVFHFL